MSEKVWLITGARRGLGREFAQPTLDAGEIVIAISRNTASVAEALGKLDHFLTYPLT